MKTVCHIWEDVGLNVDELFLIINDNKEYWGLADYTDIDPVYSVLDHILQMARNHIEEVTGYDFMNDFSGTETEIYTYGNYMCSSYDYSIEAVSELKEKVANYLDLLMKDKWCRYVLSKLGIRGT